MTLTPADITALATEMAPYGGQNAGGYMTGKSVSVEPPPGSFAARKADAMALMEKRRLNHA